MVWGTVGYGAGHRPAERRDRRGPAVSHAALLIGATPVLVALFTAGLGRARVGAPAWLGFALALAGVGFVGSHGDGAASAAGDALVFGSLLLAAAFMVAQPRMLAGRDPVAVTAVQLAAAALGALPAALLLEGPPAAVLSGGRLPTAAMTGLAVGGTLVPFTLFAWAQARVSPEIAGAFLNLEPLVGVVVGAAAFGDPVGAAQIVGGLAILAGIALNATALTPRRDRTPVAPSHRRRPRLGAGHRPASPAIRRVTQRRRPARRVTEPDRPPVATLD